MKCTVRLTVEKNKPYVVSPHYLTSKEGSEAGYRAHLGKGIEIGRGQEYAAMGIDPDLREASRKALRGLIAWLGAEKGLTREESYMLASVCADLRITEAVDMPHFAVACALPLAIFIGKPYI